MRTEFFSKGRIAGTVWLVLLVVGLPHQSRAVEISAYGPNFFQLEKETYLFHYDWTIEQEKNWLKGAMWYQYKKTPPSYAKYNPKRYSYLQDAEIVELLEKATYTTKRTTLTGAYEEGGLMYVPLPHDGIPEHTLTMYRVKALTGKAAGKEGWIYETRIGSRVDKPENLPATEVDEAKGKSPNKKTARYMVKLKSGKRIVTRFYKEAEGTVTLKKGGKTLNYPKSEIASVQKLGK